MLSLENQGPAVTEAEVRDALERAGFDRAREDAVGHFLSVNGHNGPDLVVRWASDASTSNLLFFGIGWLRADFEEHARRYAEDHPPDWIPIAADGNGNRLGLSRLGTVELWDHDEGRHRHLFAGYQGFREAISLDVRPRHPFATASEADVLALLASQPRKTAFRIARFGRTEFVDELAANHAPLLPELLNTAALHGREAFIAELVAAGADPNAIRGDGLPILWNVATLRAEAGVRALLAAGANPDITNFRSGRTLIDAVAHQPEIHALIAAALGGSS